MLLVQVRQAGFYIGLFYFHLIEKTKPLYTISYILLYVVIICYSLVMYYSFVILPWWCRGYHVGLSSPRLGFKSRPGRLIIILSFDSSFISFVIRARSSVWQSAWLLTKMPRVQFPSGPLLILIFEFSYLEEVT